MINIILQIVLLFATSFSSPNFIEVVPSHIESNISNAPTTKESRLRSGIVKSARSLIGADYVYGGTTPKGFDCSGFVAYVLSEYGYNAGRSSSNIASKGLYIPRNSVNEGDLLFFGYGEKITHVAIASKVSRKGEISIIHSTTSKGVIEENFSDSAYWKSKYMFARDIITKSRR